MINQITKIALAVVSALSLAAIVNGGVDRRFEVDPYLILTLINKLRADTAAGKTLAMVGYHPPGNIQPMSWNNELASQARDTAECREHFSNEQGVDPTNARKSTNLILEYLMKDKMIDDPRKRIDKMTAKDFTENFLYNWGNGSTSFVFGEEILEKDRIPALRFLQLVWAETENVGCALNECWLKYVFACVFQKGGTQRRLCGYKRLCPTRDGRILIEDPYNKTEGGAGRPAAFRSQADIVDVQDQAAPVSDTCSTRMQEFQEQFCNFIYVLPKTDDIMSSEFRNDVAYCNGRLSNRFPRPRPIAGLDANIQQACFIVGQVQYRTCGPNKPPGYRQWETFCVSEQYIPEQAQLG